MKAWCAVVLAGVVSIVGCSRGAPGGDASAAGGGADARTTTTAVATPAAAAPAVRTTTVTDALALLPTHDPARRILTERCLLCHGLEHVAQQRLPLAKWTAVVDKMARWGTPLAEGEAEILARALAEALPPELADVPPRRVPTPAGGLARGGAPPEGTTGAPP